MAETVSARQTARERARDKALSDGLEVWARWLTAGHWVDGYPSRSPMFGDARTSTDWEEWEDDVDLTVALSVDAAMQSLTADERAAVYTVKVRTVNSLREPLEVVYLRARTRLLDVLVRRGVIVD